MPCTVTRVAVREVWRRVTV